MTRFRALQTSSGVVGLNYKLMRPALFLFLFGIDLSMAFLPLHMDQLATPVAGLSRELLLSLPISVEFLCVGIAMLMTGSWIDRRGWQPPFLCGLLLVVAGSLYSWLAGDAWHFIASRAVLGLGYGMTLLAAKSFVIRSTTHREKAQGLSHLFAGVYSGSICGAVVGAMMANRWGYGPVFLIGALIVTLVILYAWLVYRAAMQNGGIQQALSRPAAASTIRLGQFLRDRRIVAVILFSSMPGSIAAIGFLNYFSPVYLSRLQVTEVTIGQILMLFGVCLTLFAPPIGKLVDQLDNKRLSILLGGLLACLGFLVFNLADGVVAVTVAVILLGLSNCFVLSAQSAYFLRLKVTQQLGEGKALGVFRASSRLGQMLGPTLFAGLYAVTDTQYLMTCFGLAYLATTLLFLMLTRAQPDEVPQTGLRMT